MTDLVPFDYRQYIVHAGPHPNMPIGFQVHLRFPNNWGMSVIAAGFELPGFGLVGSYGVEEGKVEVCVGVWIRPGNDGLKDLDLLNYEYLYGHLDMNDFRELCARVMAAPLYEGGDTPTLPEPSSTE